VNASRCFEQKKTQTDYDRRPEHDNPDDAFRTQPNQSMSVPSGLIMKSDDSGTNARHPPSSIQPMTLRAPPFRSSQTAYLYLIGRSGTLDLERILLFE
jgi:hypothetical protein